jgi:two-component system response regulator AtoC
MVKMKTSILIVDDSEDTRELFKATLEAEGFAVMSAKDGPAALETLRMHGDFSLMLLDLRMPGMSGFQVLQVMEQERIGTKTPVMVVSAVDDMPKMNWPKQVIDTLKKPFFYPELIFKIKQTLTPPAKEREKPAHP